MSALLYEDEVFKIRGAAFEVHGEMGNGFLEAVYHECLAREFESRAIPFSKGTSLKLAYKGQPLTQTYLTDFICFDKIILELKAVSDIAPAHRAQTINYLKATGFRLGLIINFGTYPKLQVERLAL